MTRVTGRNRVRCPCDRCTRARAARDLLIWETELRGPGRGPGSVAVIAQLRFRLAIVLVVLVVLIVLATAATVTG